MPTQASAPYSALSAAIAAIGSSEFIIISNTLTPSFISTSATRRATSGGKAPRMPATMPLDLIACSAVSVSISSSCLKLI